MYQATGDWYLWRSSSNTSFAVISVLQGKTWQTKYLKLNFSVFRCVDSVNIQPEAAQVPSSTSSHQDFIMDECSVKNDRCFKTVLFARFQTKKRNRNREKLFNFWSLVLLKDFTFHLNDKKSKWYRDFKRLVNRITSISYELAWDGLVSLPSEKDLLTLQN